MMCIKLIKSPIQQFVEANQYFHSRPIQGVYCLFNKEKNRPYIGSSKHIWRRLLNHFTTGKDVNEWLFWIVEITPQLKEREKFYIKVLKEAGINLLNKQYSG